MVDAVRLRSAPPPLAIRDCFGIGGGVSCCVCGKAGELPPFIPLKTIFRSDGVERVFARSGGPRFAGAGRLRRWLLLGEGTNSGSTGEDPASAARQTCFLAGAECIASLSLTTLLVVGNCIPSLRRRFPGVKEVPADSAALTLIRFDLWGICSASLLTVVGKSIATWRLSRGVNAGVADSAALTWVRFDIRAIGSS